MQQEIISTIRWLFRLSRVFLKNAPIETVITVIMSLVSQVSLMIAFLLPLKVIILMGSDTVPEFFPAPFSTLEKNTLILSLGALAFCFYGLMIVSDKLSDYSSSLGVNKLLQKHKFILFENQGEIATKIYSKFAESLSSLAFSIVGSILLLILYVDAGITLISILVFSLFALISLANLNTSFKDALSDKIQNIIRKIRELGFMLVFIFIVLDFLYFNPPTFIVAIIAIILSRVIMARLYIAINGLLILKNNEEKINALFFHIHEFIPEQNSKKRSVWDLLIPSSRNEWLNKLLKQIINKNPVEIRVKWKEAGLQNVIVFTVELPQENRAFLFKIFEKKVGMTALHEATLLIDYAEVLPAPPLVLITKVYGCHCHIFDITGTEFPNPQDVKEIKITLLKKLLKFTPSNQFIEHYNRSKPMLWQEINNEIFERLKLVASVSQINIINKIQKRLPYIIASLKALPISLELPINDQLLIVDATNSPLIVDWGMWKLNPIGSYSKAFADSNLQSDNLIHQIIESQYNYDKNFVASCEQASLINNLIIKYKKQQYQYILDIIIPLLYSKITNKL